MSNDTQSFGGNIVDGEIKMLCAFSNTDDLAIWAEHGDGLLHGNGRSATLDNKA